MKNRIPINTLIAQEIGIKKMIVRLTLFSELSVIAIIGAIVPLI
jgi:hypothetical protein